MRTADKYRHRQDSRLKRRLRIGAVDAAEMSRAKLEKEGRLPLASQGRGSHNLRFAFFGRTWGTPNSWGDPKAGWAGSGNR